MMENRTITCEIVVVNSIDGLAEADRELVLAARKALDLSYSPYSNFKVGAAARLEDETIVIGANQENASYPLCLCAERSVLAITANSHMDKKVTAMAVVVHNPNQRITTPASPCGACRQVLCETESRQKAPIRLLMTTDEGATWMVKRAHDLLPLAFNGALLE